jgi:hypothetical protein
MSRWHRENPEHYEMYGEPDWTYVWDSGQLKEPAPCPTCGETLTRGGQRCQRCKDGMEYDRLERESNR